MDNEANQRSAPAQLLSPTLPVGLSPASGPGEVEDLGGEVMGRLLQPALGEAFLEGAVGCVGSHHFGKSLDKKRQKQVVLHHVQVGVSGEERCGTG